MIQRLLCGISLLLLASPAWAADTSHDFAASTWALIALALFIAGYAAVIGEVFLHPHKSSFCRRGQLTGVLMILP